MKIAVTGASGHIGGNLIRALLDQGRDVRVLVHEDEKAIEGLNVEKVYGDVLDLKSLKTLCDCSSTLFHLAARISIIGNEGGLVWKINVDGVKNVIEACLACGVNRLVHFSSIHAFKSNPNNEVINEARSLATDKKHLAYDRSKAYGQLAVLDGVKQGLNAVIVHPTGVIGPLDFKPSRMGSTILDLYRQKIHPNVFGGYNWVDVRDVVNGALAAEKKGRTGENYLLSGHWKNLYSISSLIEAACAQKKYRFPIPLWLAAFAAPFASNYSKLKRRTPKFTPESIKILGGHRYISHEKASSELGYNPRPFEETIRDTIKCFINRGCIK
jgi:dihydroflavonol-4-reductase